jgi:hypothetical protein
VLAQISSAQLNHDREDGSERDKNSDHAWNDRGRVKINNSSASCGARVPSGKAPGRRLRLNPSFGGDESGAQLATFRFNIRRI